jgi:hypothetical protein
MFQCSYHGYRAQRSQAAVSCVTSARDSSHISHIPEGCEAQGSVALQCQKMTSYRLARGLGSVGSTLERCARNQMRQPADSVSSNLLGVTFDTDCYTGGRREIWSIVRLRFRLDPGVQESSSGPETGFWEVNVVLTGSSAIVKLFPAPHGFIAVRLQTGVRDGLGADVCG